MGKVKKGDFFDLHNLSSQDQLKSETVQELGLKSKVIEGRWRSPTVEESGRIGGSITKRKREMKQEALQQD